MLKRIVVALIRFYQVAISPLSPPRCRFVPSCSEYSLQAVSRFGVLRGGWLSAKRILKCGPWHKGGLDPVPTEK
ncbi:membrane protein insertion efficiency factor YidD [Alicyclobacillus tolerans]|uniref:membrane protein insertion efficiency factor YidD n=1 Tax=Alicyclobacillus tolerans TaxID=90970 RepID=UPI001F428BD9|nr:membrane protein insertion efficiency factor YidD [Alicyclobacillus tolerans]MCF8565710.1 membrane protein insertion efficiency factor YidD [Alicyclobacillus tolerans]